MRLRNLLSMISGAALLACHGDLQIGGERDGGSSAADSASVSGSGGPDAAFLPDASSGASPTDASTDSSAPYVNPASPSAHADVSDLVCAPFDASYPPLDAGSDPNYSEPLPDAQSPGSASDGWILFDSDVETGTPNIYAIHPDGSGLRVMITGNVSEPVVSPDGTTVLYTALASVTQISQLFAVTLGTSIKQITSMSEGAGQAAFSRDGKSIAFHSGRSVYVMNADGTAVRPLIVATDPNSFADYEHPTFAPDGSAVIVDSSNEIDSFNISRYETRSLVANGAVTEIFPAISRDGVNLAYVTQSQCGPQWGIAITLLSGYLPDPCKACPGSLYELGTLSHPSWGPRGLLTFSHSSSNGLKRIVVVDTSNLYSAPVEILQDNGNQQNPTWAPSTLSL